MTPFTLYILYLKLILASIPYFFVDAKIFQMITNIDVKEWKFANPKFEYTVNLNDSYLPWTGHIFFGYDLISNLKPQTIVELGTYKGTSFYSFLQAAKDNNLKSEFFAVDTWAGDEHAGFYDDAFYNDVKKTIREVYNSVNARLMRMTFDDALGSFEDASIDLLHIDGLHTYEAVKHDFDSWFPKVKKDGVIIFHDIKIADFGVWKVWDEIKKNYSKEYDFFDFEHSCGLGFMISKSNKFVKVITKLNGSDVFIKHYSYIAGDYLAPRMRSSVENFLGELENVKKERNALVSENELLRIDLTGAQQELGRFRDIATQNTKLHHELTELKEYVKQFKNRKSVTVLRKTLNLIGKDL